MLGWFALSWLQPSNVARRLQRSKGQQGFMPWELPRLVHCQPASLQGSLLLGGNDNLLLRLCRTLALCWYLPVIFIVLAFFGDTPAHESLHSMSAFIVLFPILSIAAYLFSMKHRLHSAWLVLPISRQQVFSRLEREAVLELCLGLIAIAPVAFWLLPLTTSLLLLLLWSLLLLSYSYLTWWLVTVPPILINMAFALFIFLPLMLMIRREELMLLLLLSASLIPLSLYLRIKARQQCLQQDWSSLRRHARQQRPAKL
ncbi:MAG: hypothetical protein JJU30_14445 [Alkalimonas sp.]|nr:hypothetical protein [Alkalimonas sp.]